MARFKKLKLTEKDLGINPFTETLKIEVRKLVVPHCYKREGDLFIPLTKQLEKATITKFYNTAESRLLINKLPLRSKELLLWVMHEIEYGKDWIQINKERYMLECCITAIDTYKNAVKELVKYKLLNITVVKDVYWINPSLYFKGDRVEKYPYNVVIVDDETDK